MRAEYFTVSNTQFLMNNIHGVLLPVINELILFFIEMKRRF